MKVFKILFLWLLLSASSSFSQTLTTIEAQDGIHYITNTNTTDTDLALLGTYLFQGAEPVVILNGSGTGFYQAHDRLKRPMIWGMECDESGVLKFIKGFDNAKYVLWYQYTTPSEDDLEDDVKWKRAEFTVHFNTRKMFIQGERSKDY